MSRKCTLKVFCMVICCLMAFHPNGALAQTDWKLLRHSDNIWVYAKEIEGSNLKELKTVTYFNTHMDGLVMLLTDVSAQPKFQFGCLSSMRVGPKTKFEQSFYQELYMPWPFTNRDAVFKQTIKPNSNANECIIESHSTIDLVPQKSDFVRVPFMRSKWLLKKTNESQIKAEYIIRVDPGGAVPSWLVNLFMDRGPYESVINMRKLLSEPIYQQAQISWLHETGKGKP